jgi:predicted aminopeptidase
MKGKLALAALIVALGMLSSCSLPFYLQAAGGQLELLRKRVPIDEILADPSRPGDLKQRLSDVLEIRTFAAEELQLPDNGSYRTYADLGRPYVVWNVVAADEFSTEPRRWCFPFAGCVSYRGFFDRAKAESFADRLRADGLDVYAGGSTAYSTLGYFADPVLNTMLADSTVEFAALLFHELAHQKVYVKSDSELSEAFASTIEEFGTRRWLEQRGDADGLAAYESRLRERGAFAELVAAQQQRLTQIYAGEASVADKRAAKMQAFEQLRREYAAAKDSGRLSSAYDAWFSQPLNNATLAAVATYRQWLPALHWRLQTVGLTAFYEEVETLAALDVEPRSARLEEWQRVALTAGEHAVMRQ